LVIIMISAARRPVARTLLLIAAVSACLLTPTAPADHGRTSADGSVAGIRPEGRLRKLHLVRPDLIPYPIAYEVYC
jgi:hypothetical protein